MRRRRLCSSRSASVVNGRGKYRGSFGRSDVRTRSSGAAGINRRSLNQWRYARSRRTHPEASPWRKTRGVQLLKPPGDVMTREPLKIEPALVEPHMKAAQRRRVAVAGIRPKRRRERGKKLMSQGRQHSQVAAEPLRVEADESAVRAATAGNREAETSRPGCLSGNPDMVRPHQELAEQLGGSCASGKRPPFEPAGATRRSRHARDARAGFADSAGW